MADDYTLLHKLSFNKSSQQTSHKKPFYSTTSNKPLNIATNKHSLSTAGSPFLKMRNQNLQGRLLFLLVVIVRKKVTFYLIVIYLNADKNAKHRQHCPQLSQYCNIYTTLQCYLRIFLLTNVVSQILFRRDMNLFFLMVIFHS